MAQHQPAGALSEGFEYLGFAAHPGRQESVQVMVADGYAYVGQLQGLTVFDVRDPRVMSVVFSRPVLGPRTWSGHLQVHGDLLLVSEEVDNGLFSSASPRQAMFGQPGADFSAGMRVFDISDRAAPREIGFMPVAGCGVHRMWYDGGRYAFASVFLDGYTGAILVSIDLNDPARPAEAGRWWLPGMWADGGERPDWAGRYSLHHPIVKDGIAYCAWRDAGMVMLDVRDPASPALVSRANWSPPFGGNTHNCVGLPDRQLVVVADEAVAGPATDQLKRTWIFDVREPSRPVSVSTLPTPAERDFRAEPGQFGPHNIYENRAGAWQDSSTVFVTYQNAGLRAFDISDQYQPGQTGCFVAAAGPDPAAPDQDTPDQDTPGVPPVHAVDVFVTADGLCFLSDLDRGLFALQYQG